jgi:hypothetical protein
VEAVCPKIGPDDPSEAASLSSVARSSAMRL